MQGLLSICNKTIEYSFYALFFLVPLVFTSHTSELFELNKMWLTWSLAIIIMSSWITKMILTKELRIQRTPLDIPLLLFLLAHIIATILSLDSRISWWGYYSRFNGGLLSILTYVLLYYAFVTNLGKKEVVRTLVVSLISGLIVALWGLPSHFGYDPTCLLFRGTLDVSCWTDAFKPTIRIFSSLGQPAWLSAYLAILLPISMAMFLHSLKSQTIHKKMNQELRIMNNGSRKSLIPASLFFILSLLFYMDLIFTNTRAGFLGFWAANGFFWAALFISQSIPKKILIRSFFIFNLSFVIISFFFGTTFAQLDRFTLPGLQNNGQSAQQTAQATKTPTPVGDLGGTDSGQIRLLVWDGAIKAWLANPLFGTGVETFAFAYYQHRPEAHNLTSEWDYLYNKAHNEYLNYLTTTGAFGLGTYVLFIGLFLFLAAKKIISNFKFQISNKKLDSLDIGNWILEIGIISSFITLLITNFFGFSVVITNLYLFLIPGFFLVLHNKITAKKSLSLSFSADSKHNKNTISPYQWTFISLCGILGIYLLFLLLRFWQADISYALGSNLNRSGDVQAAYVKLSDAVRARPTEPVYQDEYSINLATLGTALIQNNEATTGAQLAQEAIFLSDTITSNHPNNIIFWKSRVRIFYALSQIDPKYLSEALVAIEKAHTLAPTDAKVLYNLGVLYGQNNDPEKAIETLTKTIQIKPDYRDAYFARALFYRELATNGQTTVTQPEMQDKANADLDYILQKLSPLDEQARETLESWQ